MPQIIQGLVGVLTGVLIIVASLAYLDGRVSLARPMSYSVMFDWVVLVFFVAVVCMLGLILFNVR